MERYSTLRMIIVISNKIKLTQAILSLTSELFNLDIDNVGLDELFSDRLNADSLDRVQLMVAIEMELGIVISDDQIAACETINKTADILYPLLHPEEALKSA
jgi:acyl carrier protein